MPSSSALSKGHPVTSTLRFRRHAADIRPTRLRVTLVTSTHAADPSDRTLSSGEYVDFAPQLSTRYLIDSELGAGAVAMVYLFLDLKRDHKVPSEVLRGLVAALLVGERFLNE